MAFNADGFSYEMPWRKNYEGRAALGYLAGIAASGVGAYAIDVLPNTPFLWSAAFNAVLGAWSCIGAYRVWHRVNLLKGYPLSFSTVDDMKELAHKPNHKEEQYIGKGFIWENRHTQAAYEITKSDYYTTFISDGGCAHNFGMGWLHGIEPKEYDMWQLLAHTNGHTLITGVPGSGKTRLFDMLISQAVSRGEGVIIIDPKGDVELRNNAKRACVANGIGHRFFWFHPAHPEESVALDPLKNFTRSTEIASRITSLMPSGGSSSSFSSFAWNVLSSISDAMLMCGMKPSLVKLRGYVETGVEDLLVKAIESFCESLQNGDGENFCDELKGLKDRLERAYRGLKASGKTPAVPFQKQLAVTFANFFKENVREKYPSREISGLLSLFEHDQAHFSKMITNLLPLMGMLTNGKMGELLSPDDFPSNRPKFDTSSIVNEQFVFWLGLDSLSDAEVGQRVGALILSDLASVAGARFNFEDPKKMRPVNIFVDEAAEVLNEPFIQLLNKGRGAAMRLYVATQTIADFAAKMGGADKANQILGNINNKFALRTTDLSTQKYLAEHMPKTTIRYVMRGQGVGGDFNKPLMHSGHLSESLLEKEVPLFAPQYYALLPNLEYLAFISGGTTIKGRIPIIVDDKEKAQKRLKNYKKAMEEIASSSSSPGSLEKLLSQEFEKLNKKEAKKRFRFSPIQFFKRRKARRKQSEQQQANELLTVFAEAEEKNNLSLQTDGDKQS